jgi:hypothetical protein
VPESSAACEQHRRPALGPAPSFLVAVRERYGREQHARPPRLHPAPGQQHCPGRHDPEREPDQALGQPCRGVGAQEHDDVPHRLEQEAEPKRDDTELGVNPVLDAVDGVAGVVVPELP